MGGKYQILVDTTNQKHSVIEKADNGTGKEYWNIYIPDAGNRNSAGRIARLLNEEVDRDQARRASRDPSEI